jgi:hypothetical protein
MYDTNEPNDDALEEYYGPESTGNTFNINSKGSLSKSSVQKSFKSIEDVFKVILILIENFLSTQKSNNSI